MADTIREQIIQDIVTQAATITTANGYNTNMGSNAQRAVAEVDPDSLPAVIVWPLTEENERRYGSDNLTMTVDVEGMALHGSTAPSTIAEQIIGDLRKAFTLPSVKKTAFVSPVVEDIFYSSGGVSSYPKGDDLATGAKITLTFKYSTLTGNPYAQ